MVHSRVEITKATAPTSRAECTIVSAQVLEGSPMARRPPSTRDFAAPDDKSVLGVQLRRVRAIRGCLDTSVAERYGEQGRGPGVRGANTARIFSSPICVPSCAEIKILRRVLNLRVDFHAIDASPARWRGDAGSSPLDGASTATSSPRNDLVKNYRVHPIHFFISTQVPRRRRACSPVWKNQCAGCT